MTSPYQNCINSSNCFNCCSSSNLPAINVNPFNPVPNKANCHATCLSNNVRQGLGVQHLYPNISHNEGFNGTCGFNLTQILLIIVLLFICYLLYYKYVA